MDTYVGYNFGSYNFSELKVKKNFAIGLCLFDFEESFGNFSNSITERNFVHNF